MPDLFGNPDRMASGSAPAIAVDLFTATAERLAYESGRPLSQERTELTQGCEDCGRVNAAPSHWNDGLFSSRLCETKRQTCMVCDASFIAKPRADSTCNLCRRKAPC